VTDLHKILLPCERHDQDWKLDRTWSTRLYRVRLINYILFVCLLIFLYFLQISFKPLALFHVVFNVVLHLLLLQRQIIQLFLQKVCQLLFASVMLVNQSGFYLVEHRVELLDGFVVASDQLLFYESKLIGRVFEHFSLIVSL
jgi:hypothetical protein